MRIVLDTNVLVSGIINPHGPPGQIVDLVIADKVTVLIDDRTFAEYGSVLRRPKFGLEPRDVDILLGFIDQIAEKVSADPLPDVLPDRDDLPFLEVAVSGLADALVTGNIRHFSPAKRTFAVPILVPDEFIHQLG